MMLELSPLLTAANAPAFLDPRLAEGVLVEPDPRDATAAEAGAEAPERRGVLVDDGDRVPLLLQGLRESGSHSPAAHDDDVHLAPTSQSWSSG